MSTTFALEAKTRTLEGKGASRRLRRLEKALPAIVYGASKEPTSISLITKDFIKQLENEAFFAHIIDLIIDGKTEKVVLKDLQRHPVSNWPIHADFLRVNATQKITMKVPLHFANKEACKGVKDEGGSINYLSNDIEISCLAKDLPEFIEIDLLDLQLGNSIHITDISLPTGVESIALSQGDGHNLAIVTVLAPKGINVDDEESEGGEEGEAAAPDAAE